MNLKFLQRVLRSSWVLAIAPTFVCYLLIDKPGGRYRFTVEDFSHRTEELMAFDDLNGDGVVEWVMARREALDSSVYPTKVAIASADLEHVKSFEQVNLVDHLLGGTSTLDFGDHDRDGAREIYIFTQSSDSIFLNEIELFDANDLQISRHFITKFGTKNSDHVSLFVCGMFDHDGDKNDELYFTITAGFGLWPRLVYCFDFAKKMAVSSQYTSINLGYPRMSDMDGDGRPEIYGANNASGNHHVPTPYSDYSTWVMVYDDKLRFKFEPVGFEGFGSGNIAAPVRSPKFNGMVVLLNANDATSKEPSQIFLLDTAGNIVKKRLTSEIGMDRYGDLCVFPSKGEDHIFIFTNKLLILDQDLNVVHEFKWDIPALEQSSLAEFIDVDFDGDNEIVVTSGSHEYLGFLDEEGTLLGMVHLAGNSQRLTFSNYITQTEKKLFVKSPSYAGFIEAKENPRYYLGYLVTPGIYAGFVVLIFAVQLITTRQVEKNEEQKRRMQELMLRSMKGQLDPHFMFNALTAIGSMLKHEDRNIAYDYLAKFASLLRTLVDDSEKVWRPVEEEIAFVKLYLELEKSRFMEKIDFSVEVSGDITGQESVPVMCIQIFAENAVKHGIASVAFGGMIWISVRRVDGFLEICIRDNGIGRAEALRQSQKPGKGLKMTSEFYEMLNATQKRKIEFSIRNLYDTHPVGTEVVLMIPA